MEESSSDCRHDSENDCAAVDKEKSHSAPGLIEQAGLQGRTQRVAFIYIHIYFHVIIIQCFSLKAINTTLMSKLADWF